MVDTAVPYRRHPLDFIFAPRNVAVIGASETEGSVGRTLLWNLISNPFGGTVYPVNPRRSSVLGIHAYPSVLEVPGQIDLAVIVTRADFVPGIIDQCVEAGVKGAIIVSAGFKEIGEEGAKLEQEILEIARSAQMRIIGPNCLGVMSPLTGLNATFAKGMARPGNVGFISQSGALCTAVLDWSFRENVGFSAFVSVGSMLDVDWGDLIYYLGDDDRTRSIVMYMESVGNAQAFMSAAREVSLTKPDHRHQGRSHRSSGKGGRIAHRLLGRQRRCPRRGLPSLRRIARRVYLPSLRHGRGARQTTAAQRSAPDHPDQRRRTGRPRHRPSRWRAAASWLTSRRRRWSSSTRCCRRHWSHNNPVDIIGDAGPKRYQDATKIAVENPNTDGVLVILTPQDMTRPTQTAEQLAQLAAHHAQADPGQLDGRLGRGGRRQRPEPRRHSHLRLSRHRGHDLQLYVALRVQLARHLRDAVACPWPAKRRPPTSKHATELIEAVRAKGRTILTEYESKQVFAAYGISTVDTFLATTADEAVEVAEQIGYPVVVKLNSETITHKSDVNGVHLELDWPGGCARSVRQGAGSTVAERVGEGHFQGVTVQPMERLDGYELIIGSSPDPQFGPVILFGTGGTLVEVFKDRALGLPPLNTTLARRMMEQTHIFQALKGVRGRESVDIEALERLMVRFSNLVVEQPRIKEIDINPLFASPDRLVALDARIVLHDPEVADEDLPKTAIRPYPAQYTSVYTFRTVRTSSSDRCARKTSP